MSKTPRNSVNVIRINSFVNDKFAEQALPLSEAIGITVVVGEAGVSDLFTVGWRENQSRDFCGQNLASLVSTFIQPSALSLFSRRQQ